MKLSELILAHGDDTVQFQNLDACLISVAMPARKRTVTRVEFGTEQGIDPVSGATDRLGLIVWLDRDKVAEIMKGLKS